MYIFFLSTCSLCNFSIVSRHCDEGILYCCLEFRSRQTSFKILTILSTLLKTGLLMLHALH